MPHTDNKLQRHLVSKFWTKKNQLRFSWNLVWWVESGCYICLPNFSKIGNKKIPPMFVVVFKTSDERSPFVEKCLIQLIPQCHLFFAGFIRNDKNVQTILLVKHILTKYKVSVIKTHLCIPVLFMNPSGVKESLLDSTCRYFPDKMLWWERDNCSQSWDPYKGWKITYLHSSK